MNKSSHPEISVLMTAFNSSAFLAEAIESVLGQKTSRIWELQFVDDGSTDETLEIAMAYARRDPHRIFVHKHLNGENRGISDRAILR